jgi:diguanylate cyclase (GGDEF)-like protein
MMYEVPDGATSADCPASTQEETFRRFLLGTAPIPFCLCDDQGRVHGQNTVFSSLLGVPNGHFPGELSLWNHLIPICQPGDGFRDGSHPRLEAVLERLDGGQAIVEVFQTPLRVEGQRLNALHLLDITKYKENDEKLRRQALHDPLTSLPNRLLMIDRLREAVASQDRGEDGHFAVLYVDIDDFKSINDNFGHDAGDMVLVEVARRLQDGIRKYDRAARWGGDEFVVFLGSIAGKQGIRKRVQELLRDLSKPIALGSENVTVASSIGLVFNEGGYDDYKELLRDADRAMYQAKKILGNSYVVHEQYSEVLQSWEDPVGDLRSALEGGQLFLQYQPIVRIADKHMVGVEGLIRWEHETRGAVPPPQIIAIAEQGGLLSDLTLWVVETALEAATGWNVERPQQERLFLHLNCSTSLISDQEFNSLLGELLKRYPMMAQHLYLELPKEAIEESRSIDGGSIACSGLRKMVAVDDLSLSIKCLNFFCNMKAIPFEVVKIDKSIIQYLAIDRNIRNTLQSFVKIFASMGLSMVAKNVETEEQYEMLKELNCKYAQGYFIGRPIDGSALQNN